MDGSCLRRPFASVGFQPKMCLFVGGSTPSVLFKSRAMHAADVFFNNIDNYLADTVADFGQLRR